MTLSLESWLPKAQALELGEKRTVTHDCGPGRKLVVEHKEDGYAAWCYRCSEPGWHPKPRPSLSERISALTKKRAVDVALRESIRPPMPAVFEPSLWPEKARVWLYRAGLDNDWIKDIGFYWAPDAQRVVMPVLDDQGSLAFWQARGFDPERAKYLSPALPQGTSKPVYKAATIKPVEDFRADILCITEDILSANRVAQSCHAWSILGTSLTPEAEAQIMASGFTSVLVWLDPDDAGVKGRRKIVPRLRSLGLDAKAIRSDGDPKEYSIARIAKFISKGRD